MRDERGLVGRAAITIMVLIVLVGLAGVDGGSVILAKLQISDTADAAATAASESWDNIHNFKMARAAAAETTQQRDPSARVASFAVSPKGTVRVTIRKVATTMFLFRLHFLRHLAVVESTSTVTSGAGVPG